jgi:hypothetical protein
MDKVARHTEVPNLPNNRLRRCGSDRMTVNNSYPGSSHRLRDSHTEKSGEAIVFTIQLRRIEIRNHLQLIINH